ncbi:hypothetical protein GCM10010517_34170 [Streptosporangium fragile]|uniref:DUF4345 domain-containing protein n=1 Tax=Streptosporangium fragile TaxID=46186 RepID=A0ABP6IGL2_9ACTN
MIDTQFPLASWFLLVSAVGFLAFYALPLLVAPLRWARWFQWEAASTPTDLTVYFGRCLGGVAVAITWVALAAAPDPEHHLIVFDLIAVACGLMTLIHVDGAVRRTQPWTETVEIGLYAVLCGASVAIRFLMLA